VNFKLNKDYICVTTTTTSDKLLSLFLLTFKWLDCYSLEGNRRTASKRQKL